MSTVREEWNRANETGENTVTTHRLRNQIAGTRAEHEAFHAMMKLVPAEFREEAIDLWVKATMATGSEAYNRRMLMSELSESEYRETQDIAHEEWRKMMGFAS